MVACTHLKLCCTCHALTGTVTSSSWDSQLIVCHDVECRRNELVALDLVITAVSTMFAFVAMIGELYALIRMNTCCCLFCCCSPVRMSICIGTHGYDSKLR